MFRNAPVYLSDEEARRLLAVSAELLTGAISDLRMARLEIVQAMKRIP